MADKIRELNSGLRFLFLVLAGLVVWIKLTDNKKPVDEEGEDGYQTREFDDIW
ncbi:MAG: hypothetical protein IJI74_03300 [Firmicutes bacterium]|nr:hypothetical protein [Bacillota bacterium]